MAGVQRGNVFLTVSDAEVSKYMAKGFSLVDEKTGKVIKQSVPTELGQLQRAYSEHLATIEKLTAEVERLKSELKNKEAGATKKKAPAASEPEEEDKGWDDWADAEEIEEKPKKGKKSKA